MSRNTKIAIGVGAGVLLCLCICLIGVLAYRALGKQIGQANDPAHAAQVASKIADFTIPAGYEEQMGMDLGLYRMVSLVPTDDPSKPMIMLMGYSQSAGTNSQQMQEQMQRTFEQQAGTPGITWSVVDEHTVTIRGQQVNVVVREDKASSGFSMRQAVAAFEGENGTVLVMIQGDSNSWDDNLIDSFLTSIR